MAFPRIFCIFSFSYSPSKSLTVLTKPFSREQIKEKLDIIFSSNQTNNNVVEKVEIEEDRFKDVPVHVFDFTNDK